MPSYGKYKTAAGLRWFVRWSAVDPLTRKRLQPSRRPFRTRADAEAWYVKHVAGKRVATTSTITLAAYLERWLAGRQLKRNTAYTYRAAVRSIGAHIGHVRLRDLTPAHVRAWHAALREAGYAPRSIATYHAVLTSALTQAVDDELLYRNPASRIGVAKPERAPRPHWSPDELTRFLDRTAGDWDALPYRLMLLTGLRPGECRALRWADVDLRRGTLAVPDSKTPSGVRTFALPERAHAELRAWRPLQIEQRLQHPWWTDHDLVITSPVRGGYPLSSSALNRRLRRYCAELALPAITPHGLRHSFATWMAALGVHPLIVQHMLGHATISQTLDTYSHASEAMSRQAAAAIDSALDASRAAPVQSDALS